jgi:uncharacterized damage-inducible protein DinB
MKKLLLVVGIGAAQLFAQEQSSATQSAATAPSSGNMLTMAAKYMFTMSKTDVLKSAQEMPEENYSFKPVATVRTFGQLVAHVADAQYEFCGPLTGDTSHKPGTIEKTVTSKAALIQALQDAFGYCDKALNGMTDAQGTEMVSFFGHNIPKLSLFNFDIAHNMEHYGNMVTYLRIKGLVPPSSQQSGQ